MIFILCYVHLCHLYPVRTIMVGCMFYSLACSAVYDAYISLLINKYMQCELFKLKDLHAIKYECLCVKSK